MRIIIATLRNNSHPSHARPRENPFFAFFVLFCCGFVVLCRVSGAKYVAKKQALV
jgi:hypothetical protein